MIARGKRTGREIGHLLPEQIEDLRGHMRLHREAEPDRRGGIEGIWGSLQVQTRREKSSHMLLAGERFATTDIVTHPGAAIGGNRLGKGERT